MENLGLVILVLASIPWMWFVNRTLEQRQWIREPLKEQEAFGSKRWHLPAFAFIGFLVIVSTLLLYAAEDPR